MHITVSDPVQHADGLNKYTSYRVDVRPSGPGSETGMVAQPSNSYSAVLRRYSDFLWLYNQLHVERSGAIVPPIPEKQPVGRFSPAFVEERRMQLERFLRRAALHPELADAACLDTFLRADDVTFAASKLNKQTLINHQPASSMPAIGVTNNGSGGMKKDGFKRWFAEAKTSMSGDLVRSPDDDLFDEISRYIHGLDNQMRNVSHQATGLVKKGKEIANGMFEFGLAFQLLGQSEADALGEALQQMGATADRLSVISAEHADKEVLEFEEPLTDYIKYIHEAKLALQRRHEKRLTYSTCLSDVSQKQNQLGKLRAQLGKEAAAYQTEQSLRRAQLAAEAASNEFQVVSQRVLREVDRFKREKAEDMRTTVLSYIQLQVKYNKQMEAVWAALIPALEQVQLDNSGGSGDAAVSTPAPPQQQVAGQSSFLQQQQQQLGQAGNVPGVTGSSGGDGVEPVPPPSGGVPSGMISVQYRE